MSGIYSDVASFGRITAIISAIISTIIGLFIIGLGIYFLISKPEQEQTESSRKIAGIFSIVFGALFIIIPWLWVLLTQKSKFVAAVGGVGSGIDIIKNI